MYERTSNKSVELPGTCSLYKDVTKRVSTCTLCKQPIMKGDPRIVFYARLREGRQMPKGKGKMFRQRKFMHAGCLAKWAVTADFWEQGTNTSTTYRHHDPMAIRCFDCKFPIQVPDARAYLHKRSANVYLCKSCSDSPRWRHCRYCDQYVKRYSASPVLGPIQGYFCCDYCKEEHDEVKTIKSEKQRKREERARTGR